MIDWINHDGVNLAMINDHVRNQFFDRVLMQHVRDRDCIDVGFGTGLLSMMALQHGARSITAVESDPERYRLGLDIIRECGLDDRIRLFNTRFTHDMPLYTQDALIFTETVNGNLWQEGLWNSLPRYPGQVWLPGLAFMEIHGVPVPHSFAAGLGHEVDPGTDVFDPGVDVDVGFIYAVNKYLSDKPAIHGELGPGLHCLTADQLTPWGPKPWLRSLSTQHPVLASYDLDIEQCSMHIEDVDRTEWHEPINFDRYSIELCLDTSLSHERPVILIPRCGIAHGVERLYLDRGHWGPMQDPVIVVGMDRVQVSHLITGQLIYEEIT